MKKLTSEEIRNMWISYWTKQDHQIIPNSSLVPKDDPTLLWINSGVATIKHYLDGSEIPERPRLANVQRCIRTNDIENVGHTARHQTLFEMLGNWSIGDYFKKEMIPWAWEFLTDEEWLGLDKDRLYMTYYPDDQETYQLWAKTTGLSEDHFVPLKENIWDLGAGPSGPDTEIFFDRGEKYQNLPDDDPEMFPGGENERYLEIWNIVFSQYNHMPDDTYQELKQKNIDTGMGLERMASVIQDTPTNFETDLFQPIIQHIETLTDIHYGDKPETDISFKVISDHTRAVSFAIADKALPSNEGRGYVLRRLIRRAVLHGRTLGIQGNFLKHLVPVLVEKMKGAYPNLEENQELIERVLDQEESRFAQTIEEGQKILNDHIQELKESRRAVLSGKDAFQLFDTYGFPLELTEELIEKEGLSVDHDGFNEEMEAQKERARAARKDVGGLNVQSTVLGQIEVDSEFTGYTDEEADTTISAIVWKDELVNDVPAGEVAYIVTEKTPFYAERGGQVGDTGEIYTPNGDLLAHVKDTQHAPNEQNLHEIEVIEPLAVGMPVHLVIDKARRRLIRNNHTATHLLHQALKDILGDTVNQAGSVLDDQYLRFDFTYFGTPDPKDLQKVEDLVNEKIYEQLAPETIITDIDHAKNMGAVALFGDRYDNFKGDVRVVNIDDWSIELCGGTHVSNTGMIGLFKIISESGIGSGIRRIEAVTSKAAIDYFNDHEEILEEVDKQLKVKNPTDLTHRLSQLDEETREMKQKLTSLEAQLNHQAASNLFEKVEVVDDLSYISANLPGLSMKDLREISDEWKQRQVSDVLVLGTSDGEKANLLVEVNQKAIEAGKNANDMIKALAPFINGGGGGRKDHAQAGGKNPDGMSKALGAVEEFLS